MLIVCVNKMITILNYLKVKEKPNMLYFYHFILTNFVEVINFLYTHKDLTFKY